MAIDRNKLRNLINQINQMFDTIPGDPAIKDYIKLKIMGPTINEIENLITESRAPVILLFGRSGHGKSSLINALINRRDLDTDDEIRPNTAEAAEYNIDFPGKYANWNVVDTRGIFESCRAGNKQDEASDALTKAIEKYNPDILMHVIAARDCRNIGPDLELYRDKMEYFRRQGKIMPTMICITQVDTVNPPTEWPLKASSQKAATIIGHMDFLAQDVLKLQTKPFDLNTRLKGMKFEVSETNSYVGIFPVCTYWTKDYDQRWNIDSLSMFIGENLPEVARLDFIQALGLQELLKKMSDDFIHRFSSIAGVVGTSPVPFSDMALLLPLQMLMIALIGGLSCRPVSIQTANEYLGAAGVNLAGGFIAKQVAKQLLKFIPGGSLVNGGIAASATYGMGKAAELYFFNNKIVDPAQLSKQYKAD